MPTNDERRLVAYRLRFTMELRDSVHFCDSVYWRDVFKAIGMESVGDEGGHFYTLDSVRRLADLIDPDEDAPESSEAAPTSSDKAPKCDREALLALADELEEGDVTYLVSTQYVLDDYARRIREAVGE